MWGERKGKRIVGGYFKVLSLSDREDHDAVERKREVRKKCWLGEGDNELFLR